MEYILKVADYNERKNKIEIEIEELLSIFKEVGNPYKAGLLWLANLSDMKIAALISYVRCIKLASKENYTEHAVFGELFNKINFSSIEKIQEIEIMSDAINNIICNKLKLKVMEVTQKEMDGISLIKDAFSPQNN